MYVRVARFEGGDADSIRASAAEIKVRAESGAPEGVDSTGFTFLIDPDGGRALGLGFFETEEAMNASEDALDAMSPPAGGLGQRVSVERYEVAFEAKT